MRSSKPRSRFTLIELLAVVAVIAVVVSLVTAARKSHPEPAPDTVPQTAGPTSGNWGTTCCLAPVSTRGAVYGDHLIANTAQFYRYTLPAGRYTASCTSTVSGNMKATITYGAECSSTSGGWIIGQLNGGDSYTFDVPAGVTISVACYVIAPAVQGDYTIVIR